MNMKKVVVAFSGGLDTSYTVMYLTKNKRMKAVMQTTTKRKRSMWKMRFT